MPATVLGGALTIATERLKNRNASCLPSATAAVVAEVAAETASAPPLPMQYTSAVFFVPDISGSAQRTEGRKSVSELRKCVVLPVSHANNQHSFKHSSL